MKSSRKVNNSFHLDEAAGWLSNNWGARALVKGVLRHRAVIALLMPYEVAKELWVPLCTLAKWRSAGEGSISFVKVG